MEFFAKHRRAVSLGLSVFMAAALLAQAMTAPAFAVTKSELEAKKAELQKQLDKEKNQLASIQNEKKQAKEAKASLENQSTLIQGQISVLLEEISTTQAQVVQKKDEVTAKQAEIDQRWEDYKKRVAAMQQLHDGGAVAMLSSCASLYELLTFNDTLQQITEKDNEVLDELTTARQELSEQQAALEATEAELENQQVQLETKKSELATNIKQQNSKISEAEAAEQAQQSVINEAQAKLNAAVAELESYLNSQNNKYSNASIHCSLDFICPLSSYKYITTQYGSGGHTGVDLAAGQGTPIKAAAGGTVTVAGYHYSYGNYVQVYHGTDDNGNSYSTLYAHMCQTPAVSVGQSVNKGDVLGYVGNTGYSFGNHLHLELRVNGGRTNPLSYIPH